jgi:putative MATE family efflux protein
MDLFYRRAFRVAVPVAVHSLIISSINMADVFMIGQLGEVAIAALGISNQLMFLFILLLFGMGSGGQIFVSQFFGKKDLPNLHRVMGIMIIPAVILSFIVCFGALFIPHILMSVFSKDAEVLNYSTSYLKIVGFSYPFTAISFIYQIVLRSTDKPNVPMFTSFCTLIVNVVLNWLLIFGNLGFPQMGIEGAAIATLIARIMETVFTLGIVYMSGSVAAAKLKNMFDFNRLLIKRVFKTSIPVFINEASWSSGIVVLNIIFAQLGTESIAAINIMESFGRITFAGIIGVAHAGGVILGQDIGAGKMDKVWEDSKKFSKLAILIGCVTSIILYIAAHPVISIYNISDNVAGMALKTIMVWVFILPIVSFNCLNIVGMLRCGGDTKAALWIDIGGLWMIGVPLALLGAFYFGLPIFGVYLLAKIEEVFKFIIGMHRYVSKKWIRNLVDDID